MGYYQVTGTGPFAVDYPNGEAVAHAPGQIIDIDSRSAALVRGLRAGRLRELSDRESAALRAAKAAPMIAQASKQPKAASRPIGDDPLVILDS